MHKVGIIVPFRDRWEQLEIFYKHIIPYLKGTEIQYRIITIEQDDAKAFNRGMLCNIGFKEAEKLNCDYVIFHDVDILPIDVDYSYSDIPIHIASDQLPFITYFGGVTLFPAESFKKVNGFSNQYWGWGFEDDDLRRRCHLNGINYGIPVSEPFVFNKPTTIFNGIYSYIHIKNKINTARDFRIQLKIRHGEHTFDATKMYDLFTILTIPSVGIKLELNSFSRFFLSFFDKKGIYYDSTSETIVTGSNILEIEYKKKEKSILFKVNNKTVEKIQLENILKIQSNENIILGCNKDKQNFYKGTVDTLEIDSNRITTVKVSSDYIQNYSWVNKVDGELLGEFNDILVATYEPIRNIGNNIPHRRKSIFRRLEHEDQGYSKGVWKHSTTRWNQVRFNNNTSTHNKDGLSNCEYKVHFKSNKNKIVHLKVGI